MDLRHLLRVLGRFRFAVIVGVLLTCMLSFLSFVNVSRSHGKFTFHYRASETFESHARLWVTLPGFSAGQSLTTGTGQAATHAQSIAQAESRLESLAVLYAGLATGDPVLKSVRAHGPIKGSIVAVPGTVQTGGGATASLPIVDVGVTSHSAFDAQRIANDVSNALRIYVRAQQQTNGVAPKDRVELDVLNVADANQTKVVARRSKTLPIIVFLTGLMAMVALVSILENLRPRVQVVAAAENRYEEHPAGRRSTG